VATVFPSQDGEVVGNLVDLFRMRKVDTAIPFARQWMAAKSRATSPAPRLLVGSSEWARGNGEREGARDLHELLLGGRQIADPRIGRRPTLVRRTATRSSAVIARRAPPPAARS
jgi:hypothetical protein